MFNKSVMARITSIFTGTVAVLCALYGIYFNVVALAFAAAGTLPEFATNVPNGPLPAAFYSMSAICLICHGTLLWAGFKLARRRFSVEVPLIATWIFELVYFYPTLSIWQTIDPGIGPYLAASNGGMSIQFLAFLPVWGPVAVIWAKRNI
jgi:hypothetical protein